MKKIGITGGIGAGKSLICKFFELLDIPAYPADFRAKWLQENDPELVQQIKSNFGEESYHSNGSLNRSYLSKVVFSDDEKLKLLNRLVHPAVKEDFIKWCTDHSDKPYVLKEAALLFETNSYKELDATINVHASEKIRLKRTLARDPHRSEQDVKNIMKKQFDDAKRIELADFVILNDETESVIKQVIALDRKLKSA